MNNNIRILTEGETGYGGLIEFDGYTITENTKLFTESFDRKSYLNKPFTVNCILQKANTKNKNGRIYPRNVLEKEMKNYQKLVNENAAVGELDHPDSTNISGKNISHSIRKVWWDNDTVWGELELHISPGYIEMGVCSRPADYVFDDLRRGIKYGISSRGVGSVNEANGEHIVQEDFELICFDLVITPSTPGAYLFPNREINESTKNINNKTNLFNNLNNFLNEW